jgi:hypothetical protein
MESAFPYQNWQGDPIMIFFWMDGIVLELCNRKEKCCTWSLVAMTSHIITLSMSPFARLDWHKHHYVHTKPCFMTWYCLCIFHSDRVHSLMLVYHRAMSYGFVSDFMYPSCFYLAKWMSFPITECWSLQVRSSYTDERHHPSTLEFEKDDHIYLRVSLAKGMVLSKLVSYTEWDIQGLRCFPCVSTWKMSALHAASERVLFYPERPPKWIDRQDCVLKWMALRFYKIQCSDHMEREATWLAE